MPKIFTAIAFDSGGVASGPMTATFLLPLAQGACEAVGGTVIHDKGTGGAHAEKFLGVSLVPEKEMVFIVAKADHKKAIMESIMKDAGVKTDAKAIVFSLPVTDTASMRLLDELEMSEELDIIH